MGKELTWEDEEAHAGLNESVEQVSRFSGLRSTPTLNVTAIKTMIDP
jgi:hypothetical protein